MALAVSSERPDDAPLWNKSGVNLVFRGGKTYRANVVRQEDKPLVRRHLEFSGGQVL